MKISVVSGGFDPIHSGHIVYINAARNIGDKLIVCLNSDAWLTAKKGKPFLEFNERKLILESLVYVDEVISFNDDDGSCSEALSFIKQKYPMDKIIFCNGGDRNDKNIPELNIPGIEFVFGVGGSKKLNSSSDILLNWKTNYEERSWGGFHTLFGKSTLKVKELIVKPNSGMSYQKHELRSELWLVHEGSCNVFLKLPGEKKIKKISLNTNQLLEVPEDSWHQILNMNDVPCKLIEIQFGKSVNENDINRKFYFPKTPHI